MNQLMNRKETAAAVDAQCLTKHYRVYRKPFDRLKEAITRRPCHDLVEALSGLSFQIPHGDTIGIIGENGAGKSTLLKILAGTLRPTSGKIDIKGRLAALLELGSGFHPEFSGRENIYLNAALLGLNEKEVREREGDIIEFSGLEEVIDRPVKTYSTGMYMRLGFSIATSVDPEILIVDEALSVGDQRFQQKCVDRMVGFSRSGKTIIICSHNMYLINELCAHALWLREGRMRTYGKTSDVIAEYLAYFERESEKEHLPIEPNPQENSSLPEIMIEHIRVLDKNGKEVERFRQFETVVFQVKTKRTGPSLKGHLGMGIDQADGKTVFGTTTKISGHQPMEFVDEQNIEFVIPSIPFLSGSYRAVAFVGDLHALRPIDRLISKPFMIESNHPEFGAYWVDHFWRFDGGRQSATQMPR
jgi:ABC-type polysaccharide/polyol phosphate transport system ATPase subunit